MLAVWDTLSIARKGIGLDTFELSVEQNARIEQNLGPIGRLEPTMDALLESMGFTMVRVQLMGRESPTLQIMAERLDGLPMTADNCADISRALSPLLESEDPITEAYNLEVSSPGIDRPLTRAFDFVRFAGHLVKVENRFEIEGRRRFTGELLGIDINERDGIMVIVDVAEFDEPIELALTDVAKAKLTMTDALVDAAQAEAFGPPMGPDGSVAPWPAPKPDPAPEDLDPDDQDAQAA